MSKFKSKRIFVIFLFLAISFFAFGCENKTEVEDVYFDLQQSESVVMYLGQQDWDVGDLVVVKPSYASNVGFKISSLNESVVSVNGTKLRAVGIGNALIKVASTDDDKKQDFISISVKENKSQLETVKNIRYDATTQIFNFDSVLNANSYLVSANGNEFEIGNSTTFSFAGIGATTSQVVSIKIKALSSYYSFAYEDSDFSEEFKMYQAKEISNLEIKGGVLTFVKPSSVLNYDFYIDDQLTSENLQETSIDLKNYDYGTKNSVKFSIKSVVSNSTKQTFGEDVHYFDSVKQSKIANIVSSPVSTLSNTILTWNKMLGAQGYEFYLNGSKVGYDDLGQIKFVTTSNTLDLKSLVNYDSIALDEVNSIYVKALLSTDVENLVLLDNVSETKFVKLSAPKNIRVTSNGVVWDAVENASNYKFVLNYGENSVERTVISTSLDLNGYPSNEEYSITVMAEPKESAGKIYYLPSNFSDNFNFKKQSKVEPIISNYTLSFGATTNDSYQIKFVENDNSDINVVRQASSSTLTFDLSGYNFTSGKHDIEITHLGSDSGENKSVNSGKVICSFVQLSSVNAQMINSKLVVTNDNSGINEENHARILLKTIPSVSEKIELVDLQYNYLNESNESILEAGDYCYEIYVEGDGANTFSVRTVGEKSSCVCADGNFKVLSAPSDVKVVDNSKNQLSYSSENASSYSIFQVEGEEDVLKNGNETTGKYNFTLPSGCLKFKVMANGNGTNTLNSAKSSAVEVVKLKTPTLAFDNSTSSILLTDENLTGVANYVFNTESVDYFTSKNVTLNNGNNVFKIFAVGQTNSESPFYMNSGEDSLTINKIDASSVVTINENNILNINPTDKSEEYDLVLIFNLQKDDSVVTYEFKKTVDGYKCGEIVLPYNYNTSTKSYEFNLINDNFKTIIKDVANNVDLINGFGVQVKMLANSNDGPKADSDFCETYADTDSLFIQKITSTSLISLNSSASNYVKKNKIIISHVGDNKEYYLKLKLNFVEEVDSVEFVADNGKLVYSTYSLPYKFDSSTHDYIVDLLDENDNFIVEKMKTKAFKVSVLYTNNVLGTDIDSDYSAEQELSTVVISEEANVEILKFVENLSFGNELSILATNQTTKTYLNIEFDIDGTKFNYVEKTVGEDLVLTNGLNEIGYTYSDYQYTIPLADANYDYIFDGLNDVNQFSIKFSFLLNDDGIATDLDSGYVEKIISIAPTVSVLRSEQIISFNDIIGNNDINDYVFVINDEKILHFSSLSLNSFGIELDVSNNFKVDMQQFNNSLASLGIDPTKVNALKIVSLNNSSQSSSLIVSKCGSEFEFSRAKALSLSTSKNNSVVDNSQIVTLTVPTQNYSRKILLQVYNVEDNEKTNIKTIELNYGANNEEDVYSIRLDNFDLEGRIYVSAFVLTSEVVNVEGLNINMFNSEESNVVKFDKLIAPNNVYLSNNILYFSADNEHSYTYELYNFDSGLTTLITEGIALQDNHFVLPNFEGEKKFYIKAVAIDGYTNSSLSSLIKIKKTDSISASMVDGNLCVTLPNDVLGLISNDDFGVQLKIVDNFGGISNKTTVVDLKNVDNSFCLISDNKLYLDSNAILAYPNLDLTIENLTISVEISCLTPNETAYYYNPDIIENFKVCGLFSVDSISKTTDNSDITTHEVVETISWVNSSKNVYETNEILAKYMFELTYFDGENTYTYLSTDAKLKYYDNGLKSYSKFVGNSVIFPCGYDIDNNGTLDVEFGAGKYSVRVKTVPDSALMQFASSKFSFSYEFEILKTVELRVENGVVVWDKVLGATSYVVNTYKYSDNSGDKVAFERNNNYFKFEELGSGIFAVEVKAICKNNEKYLNGEFSKLIYVYRLPDAQNVEINDGKIIFEANKLHSKAKIYFYDNGAQVEVVEYDFNLDNYENNIKNLVETSWEDLINSSNKNDTQKYVVDLNSLELQNVVDGKNYTIKIELIGNSVDYTDESLTSYLGVVSSSVVDVDLILHKTKVNVNFVELGVLQFLADESYLTLKDELNSKEFKVKNVNYNFGNVDNLSKFWNNTIVYKLVLTSSAGSHVVYAVDYFSFVEFFNYDNYLDYANDISSGTLDGNEDFAILNSIDDLFGYVKFKIGANEVYFNIYKDNKINFRDNESLRYFGVSYEFNGEDFAYTGTNSFTTVNLNNIGSFIVDVYMLGGDSAMDETYAFNFGYIDSKKSNDLKTFIRYKDNNVYAFNGKLYVDDLRSVTDGEVDDYPVYMFDINYTVDGEDKQSFVYLYYQLNIGSDVDENNAKKVASREDPVHYLDANRLYVPIDRDSFTADGNPVFDMSKYFQNSGVYKISVRTLAGVGTSSKGNQDYLMNARDPNSVRQVYQFDSNKADNQVVCRNGNLMLPLSKIVKDSVNTYSYDYEITIKDLSDENIIYVYTISTESEGVTLNGYSFIYAMPSQVLATKINLSTGKVENNVSLQIVGGETYHIETKAIVKNNDELLYINGGYGEGLDFSKCMPTKELFVENGKLYWEIDESISATYNGVIIDISFEYNSTEYRFEIKTNGVLCGYGLYYYEFKDNKYTELNSNTEMFISALFNGTSDEIDYKIKVSVTSLNNVLNSVFSDEIVVNRLDVVDENSIISNNGKLSWNDVSKANGYIVTLRNSSSQEFVFETSQNEIDFVVAKDANNNLLQVGTYSIKIRAVYISDSTHTGNILNAMVSNYKLGFRKLPAVENVGIDSYVVYWDDVEGADAYKVVFTSNYGTDKANSQESVVDTEEFEVPAVDGGIGKFKIEIWALSVGENKIFNSDVCSLESIGEVPNTVKNLVYDPLEKRFIWSVDDDFGPTDKLHVEFNQGLYTKSGKLSSQKKSIEIGFEQAENYLFKDENGEITHYYYYRLKDMAEYSSFAVRVERTGTIPSRFVYYEGDNIDFNFFKCGNGTTENPYIIETAQQLFNISEFAMDKVNFKIEENLDLTDFVLERLQTSNYLIAEKFNGYINGSGSVLSGLNDISLTNVSEFALFGELDGATIENLVINSITLSNTFAKSNSNVLKLSVIAIGAKNSKISDVEIDNFRLGLLGTATKDVYIAGLIANSNTNTITNCKVSMMVELGMALSENSISRIGGICAYCENSTLENCSFECVKNEGVYSKFITNQTESSQMLTYVGGIVAEGSKLEITNCESTVYLQDIKTWSFGGMIAKGSGNRVSGGQTLGNLATTFNVDYECFIGGVAGDLDKTTIDDVVNSLTFNLKMTNDYQQKVGAIVGRLKNVGSAITQCVNAYEFIEESEFADGGFKIGVYGTIDAGVSVECKLQK